MPLDSNFLLRSDVAGDLVATLTGTGFDKGGPDLVPRTYMLNVPITPTGTTPTLDAKIQESDDNSTWRDFLAMPQVTTPAGGVTQWVSGKSDARYIRCLLTVAGTTPHFGNVICAIVPAGRAGKY